MKAKSSCLTKSGVAALLVGMLGWGGCYSDCLLPVASVLFVTVVDAQTGTPVAQADVWAVPEGADAATEGASLDDSGEGVYTLTHVGGRYTLFVEADGYESATVDAGRLQGCGGAMQELTIELTPVSE